MDENLKNCTTEEKAPWEINDPKETLAVKEEMRKREFVKNRMRATFSSRAVIIRGILKLLALIFLCVGSFTVFLKITGAVILCVSAVSDGLIFFGSRNNERLASFGSLIYYVLTKVEKIYLLAFTVIYSLYVIAAMFGIRLLGVFFEEQALLLRDTGLWCILIVIGVIIWFNVINKGLSLKERYAGNAYDSIDAEICVFSYELKYVVRRYAYCILAFIYMILNIALKSWGDFPMVPDKIAAYLDSGVFFSHFGIIEVFFTLFSVAVFVFDALIAKKYLSDAMHVKEKFPEISEENA